MTAADIVSKLGGSINGSCCEQQGVLDALGHLGAWSERADKTPLLTLQCSRQHVTQHCRSGDIKAQRLGVLWIIGRTEAQRLLGMAGITAVAAE